MISMTAHCPFMRFSSGRRLKRGLRRLEKSAEFMDQECRCSADPDVSKVGRRHRVQPARSGHLSGRVPQIDHDDGHHEVLENSGEHGRFEEVACNFDLKSDDKCHPSLWGGLRACICILSKLVNSNLVWESSFPIFVLSRLAMRPSKHTTEAA